jgi:alkylation response protein AidB-like acyl-CoA dehydrogenase
MDFQFTEEQRLLVETLNRCLADEATFDQRKQTLRSAEGWSRALWSTLCGLGVPATVIDEVSGGLGGGAIELALVCQAAGQALLLEPVSSVLVVHAAVSRYAPPAVRAEIGDALIAGETLLVPVVHDRHGNLLATTAADGLQISGQASVVYHAPLADHWLVAVSSREGVPADTLLTVPRTEAGVTLQIYQTVDGQRAADLHFDRVAVPASAIWVTSDRAAVEWVSDCAILALAADTLGSVERTLSLTIDYLKNRQQFGGPIGRFQALQHRVVVALSKVEELRTWLWVTAARFDGAAADRRLDVTALHVLACETARHVGEEAVQLHGGMGVTEEMEVSHHFRRLVAAGIRYGSRDEHLAAYAQQRFGGHGTAA